MGWLLWVLKLKDGNEQSEMFFQKGCLSTYQGISYLWDYSIKACVLNNQYITAHLCTVCLQQQPWRFVITCGLKHFGNYPLTWVVIWKSSYTTKWLNSKIQCVWEQMLIEIVLLCPQAIMSWWNCISHWNKSVSVCIFRYVIKRTWQSLS